MTDAERYRTALLDWLACAAGGAGEPAARAARAAGDGLLERVAAAGTAGHVLDYDDTYAPGVIHASAAAAPAALVVAADLGKDIAAALDAYSAGFEAAAALARASHPRLYDGGWHPTAVCGTVGAAVAAAALLGLDDEPRDHAIALAILRAGGLRAAFGSDGKALQVGLAAGAGVQAAQLAAAGAKAPLERIADGYAQTFGGRWATPDTTEPAIRDNWIKAYPCCLGTHSTIEAVDGLDGIADSLTVTVHPLERQAAALDDVADGLQAKFSLPYLAAYTLLHGAPTVASFDAIDPEVRALARDRVEVRTNPALTEWESQIERHGATIARVQAALGSPQRPLTEERRAAKLHELAGDRLDDALADETRPAATLLDAADLG